jgi:hypothetical protein
MVEMTRRDVENYRFLRLYSIDLDMAKQTCDLLARQSSPELQYAVLHDLVVTYARPFSQNRGRAFKRHSLLIDVVPSSLRALHVELITLRDQAFAHTDHDFRNPKIVRWPSNGGGASYGMSFSNPAYAALLARLPEIRDLVESAEKRVNGMARDFEAKFDQLYPEENAGRSDGESKATGS